MITKYTISCVIAIFSFTFSYSGIFHYRDALDNYINSLVRMAYYTVVDINLGVSDYEQIQHEIEEKKILFSKSMKVRENILKELNTTIEELDIIEKQDRNQNETPKRREFIYQLVREGNEYNELLNMNTKDMNVLASDIDLLEYRAERLLRRYGIEISNLKAVRDERLSEIQQKDNYMIKEPKPLNLIDDVMNDREELKNSLRVSNSAEDSESGKDERISQLQDTHNKKLSNIKKTNSIELSKAEEDRKSEISKADKTHGVVLSRTKIAYEKAQKAYEDARKAYEDAQKAHKDKVFSINDEYDNKVYNIHANYAQTIADLRQSHSILISRLQSNDYKDMHTQA